MTFEEKLTELKPLIFQAYREHLPPDMLKRLEVKPEGDKRLKIKTQRELAAILGINNFNTRDERFSPKKPYTPPPLEPDGAFEKLLVLAEDKTNKIRSDAALSLLAMLIQARVERRNP